MQRQIATLSSDGSLFLRKDANFCGDLTVEGGVSLGSDVVITHDGSNVGVNMPHGTVPTYTLHVNGSVFSTQHMFALSDRRVKTDIKRIDDPLDIVEAINGYTFKMNGKACVGVIAQEVNTVMPEAVSMVNNGAQVSKYCHKTYYERCHNTLRQLSQDSTNNVVTGLYEAGA
eukprot:gene14970-21026_t